jgi:hypothetical protein
MQRFEDSLFVTVLPNAAVVSDERRIHIGTCCSVKLSSREFCLYFILQNRVA